MRASQLALVLAGCLAATAALAQLKENEQPRTAMVQQTQAAQAGLVTYQKLLAASAKTNFGLMSREEASHAQLGAPMRVFMVRLDSLKGMTSATSPDSLLIDDRRTLFPITVDSHVVSGLYTTERNGAWEATQFGEAAIARATDAQRHAASDFIVWIPAARVYFVASGSGASLTFTPVTDDPRFGFKTGVAMPADQALHHVQQGMASYNGLPG